MGIPLFNRLRKQMHREIALLQDELVDLIYSISPEAVLHGGTAIWRCYSGNRFSEDLDFYLLPEKKFKEVFCKEIEKRGLRLLKFKQTENTIYSKISNERIEVRFEASLRKPKKFIVNSYEKTDGNYLDVFTLSAEDLILEKINAFKNRKLIRDFYDVYSLSNRISLNASAAKEVQELLEKEVKPVDEKNLRTLVYSGAIPSFQQMINALKRRGKQ